MKVETFRAEVIGELRDLAWDQWARLGVSAAMPGYDEQRAADPEALLLFTLEIGRHDPRLLDETLDWLALNEQLISVQRLRNLCAGDIDRALVDSALTWVATSRPRARLGSRADEAHGGSLEPLFYGLPIPRGALDPAFERHGFARSLLTPSNRSQRPTFRDPVSFAFRLRRLLGVGVRAEVVRTLLTVRAPRLSGRALTRDACFAARNVREGLLQLHEAGVVDIIDVSDDRHYAVHHRDWAPLLGLKTAPDLPFHYDWIPALRALTATARWLCRPGLDDLSDYLRASQARTLIDGIEADLRYAGVPPRPVLARGDGYWSEFEDTIRIAVRDARKLPTTAPRP